MKLSEILDCVDVLNFVGNAETEISGLCTDSRLAKKGNLFFCYAGGKYDSHEFVAEAQKNGAVAVICEHIIDNCDLTQIVVKNGRAAITSVARAYYGYADKKLKLIAVTGTNGKTTVTHMLAAIFTANGKKAGVIGTLGISYAGKLVSPELTTPDPVFMHSTFADMAENGVEYVFMKFPLMLSITIK